MKDKEQDKGDCEQGVVCHSNNLGGSIKDSFMERVAISQSLKCGQTEKGSPHRKNVGGGY